MTLMTTPPTTVAPWRLFRTVVGAVDDLSPSLRRIRFVGQELEHFADPGLDQRIKILLGAGRPRSTAPRTGMPRGWGCRTRLAPRCAPTRPGGSRIPRLVRRWTSTWSCTPTPGLRGTGRPAPRSATRRCSWGRTGASPATRAAGPSPCRRGRRGPPRRRRDRAARDRRILEDLAVADQPGLRITALVEVPTAADCLDLTAPDGAQVVWLVRSGRPHGVALERAVRAWTMVAAGSEEDERRTPRSRRLGAGRAAVGGARGGGRHGVDTPARRLRLGRRRAGRGPRDPPPPARRGGAGPRRGRADGLLAAGPPQGGDLFWRPTGLWHGRGIIMPCRR